MEATRLAGLGNEVAGLAMGPEPAGEIELTRAGILNFDIPANSHAGFAREIKTVKASSIDNEMFADGVWMRELKRFFMSCWAVVRGLMHMLYRLGLKSATQSSAPHCMEQILQEDTADEDQDELYARFLRGEDEPEEMDGDYRADEDDRQALSEDSEYSDEEEQREALDLYADISLAQTGSMAPLLVAHMVSPRGPLTRRRFKGMSLTAMADASEWEQFVDERRARVDQQPLRHLADSESRRNCVVCTVEPREVVCWPCRCSPPCQFCKTKSPILFLDV